ncbi:MAG: hydroxymethylbilane synthase [Candidatus Dormibacteraeota bacterium]|nr:hydroxymethylbilane synthase [Candidatus Dormibacteraeota bacterium]
MSGPLRLATRGSALALAQATLLADALRAVGVQVDQVVIRTTGDSLPEVPAAAMEGQGWFTTEIERALAEDRADLAAHSAKDLPTQLGHGLEVAAYLPRGDARDGVVGAPLRRLPGGARVGTSSVRREAMLRGLRPDLAIVAMRGNVDTRLRKLDSGEVDALVLACAGLDRLGLGERAAERLDPESFVPAPGQGAIAVEARSGSEAADLARRLDDAATRSAVTAERAVLAGVGGGCMLPLGVWARLEGDDLAVNAALLGAEASRYASGRGDPADPLALAATVVRMLTG